MTIGMSGFTRAGEAKAVPLALAEPFQSDPVLRKAINAGEAMFIDQYLNRLLISL